MRASVHELDWRGGSVGHQSGLVAPSEEPCLIDIPRYVFVLEIRDDRARVSFFKTQFFKTIQIHWSSILGAS